MYLLLLPAAARGTSYRSRLIPSDEERTYAIRHIGLLLGGLLL